jgi:hypothetical protein
MRWLAGSLEKNTVQKILKTENGRISKDKESMTEKRNQRELLWFQTGEALNFITAAPHCGVHFNSIQYFCMYIGKHIDGHTHHSLAQSRRGLVNCAVVTLVLPRYHSHVVNVNLKRLELTLG